MFAFGGLERPNDYLAAVAWPYASADMARCGAGCAASHQAGICYDSHQTLADCRPTVFSISAKCFAAHADGLLPKGQNTGAVVVVFPGGGYKILAIDLEGTEICEWLASKGITGVLLKYRVPNAGPYVGIWGMRLPDPHTRWRRTALDDAQRAIGLVRPHAEEWQIDPHKIGVAGFSAGGFLVAEISTHFAHRPYAPCRRGRQGELPAGLCSGPLSGAPVEIREPFRVKSEYTPVLSRVNAAHVPAAG